jgi:hypothetical protein
MRAARPAKPLDNPSALCTEREVIKTVRPADPAHVDRIAFFYGLRLPTLRFEHVDAPAKRIASRCSRPSIPNEPTSPSGRLTAICLSRPLGRMRQAIEAATPMDLRAGSGGSKGQNEQL